MEIPFISIIVPIYNVEAYLESCIKSILNQSFNNYELILVNDGSKDNSEEICEKYAQKDNRIKVINKENGGLVSARKEGIKYANGRYIGFVDGDDWIDKDMFKEMCKAAQKGNYDIVICDIIYEYPTYAKESKQLIKPGEYDKEKLKAEVYPFIVRQENIAQFGLHPSLTNKIFKKELLRKNLKRVNEKIEIGEDMAVSIPCLLEAEKIYLLKDKFFYHYRQSNTQMTSTYKKDLFNKSIILLDHLKELNKEIEQYNLLEQLYFNFIYHTILSIKNEFTKFSMKTIADKIKLIRDICTNTQVAYCMKNCDFSKGRIQDQIFIYLIKKKRIYTIYLLTYILSRRGGNSY